MHRGVDLLTVLRLLLLVLAARMINSFGEKKPQKARRGVSFGGSKIEALDPNLSPSENAVKIHWWSTWTGMRVPGIASFTASPFSG